MATWYCCRQRAGPLVKECRALRPRFSPEDTDADYRAKEELRRRQNGTFDRHQVDRLELRLALLGFDGVMHTLTFDPDHLPRDFRGVRRELQSFFKRWRRWRAERVEDPRLRYLYAIEGLHRRYHVHLCADANELSGAEASYLWRAGAVDTEWILYPNRRVDLARNTFELVDRGGFRRLAAYLNKERTDGFVIPIGRHPWSCSRALAAELPPPEKWKATDGGILVPDSAIWVRRGCEENDWGAFHYASWIEPKKE